jgi:hypothetical protein
LQGRGVLTVGPANQSDRLVALVPISSTATYTLYFTSAAPTSGGLAMRPVSTPGVQTLTVSPSNPLILFNLKVSLEWDARKDTRFTNQLRFDLQRASELLYDWTDGQAALGDITIYHNREHWETADVRIYASNRLRPSAIQGGIVASPRPDPQKPEIVYAPGQVRMGATWNRYGEAGDSLSEDWPRTFAHELGHYALFLDDNYLGVGEDGVVIAVDGCPGAMSDPYNDVNSEFHPAAGWLPACQDTLSNRGTQRSDWATIKAIYDRANLGFALRQPAAFDANPGPSALPLAVTRIVEPPASAATSGLLDVPIFYLANVDGSRYQPSARARGFLFQGARLAELGRPTLDQVNARGAREGDRVCLYDQPADHAGCATIRAGNERLTVEPVANWQPEIVVTAVTSATVDVLVTNVAVPAGQTLQARLFPAECDARPALALSAVPGGYKGRLSVPLSCAPALEGHVQVHLEGAAALRETVVKYAMGGNPGYVRTGGGYVRTGGGYVRTGGGYVRTGGAPLATADSELIVVGEDLVFDEGEILTLQTATYIPSPPPWATAIGNAYWLSASPGSPDLGGASVSFNYLGREVPPGQEAGIRVYFRDSDPTKCAGHPAPCWRQLPTRLDQYHNIAAAPIPTDSSSGGKGLYAIMSSVALPLYGAGWNLFYYPSHARLPVKDALGSIDGQYTTIYSHVITDTVDPWKVYDAGVPAWVDDLSALEFGHGYWINVITPTTILINGDTQPALATAASGSIPIPPATYYSILAKTAKFTPKSGIDVVALVNGKVCGRAKTRNVDGGQVGFAIDVVADDGAAAAGCGVPGRAVTIRVGSQAASAIWDNSRVRRLNFGNLAIYLPLVRR